MFVGYVGLDFGSERGDFYQTKKGMLHCKNPSQHTAQAQPDSRRCKDICENWEKL